MSQTTPAHSISPRPVPGATRRELESIEQRAWRDFFRFASEEVRRAAGLRLEQIGPALLASTTIFDLPTFNRVVGWQGPDPVAPESLDRVVRHARRLGLPRLLVPLPPRVGDRDPGEEARDRGFRPHNRWVKLWRGADDPPRLPGGFAVERIHPEDRDEVASVLAGSFDFPGPFGPFFAGPVGRPGWSHFGIRDGGRLVAVSGLLTRGRTAWFGPAGTLPGYRGRGAQKHLLARRIEAARDGGCRLLVVETAEPTADRPVPSFHNVRRLGFEVAYRRPNFLIELAPGDRRPSDREPTQPNH